jgi:hypothetical protein
LAEDHPGISVLIWKLTSPIPEYMTVLSGVLGYLVDEIDSIPRLRIMLDQLAVKPSLIGQVLQELLLGG